MNKFKEILIYLMYQLSNVWYYVHKAFWAIYDFSGSEFKSMEEEIKEYSKTTTNLKK